MLFLNRGTAMLSGQGGRSFIERSLDLKILMIRDTFLRYHFVFLRELHQLCCSDLERVLCRGPVAWDE